MDCFIIIRLPVYFNTTNTIFLTAMYERKNILYDLKIEIGQKKIGRTQFWTQWFHLRLGVLGLPWSPNALEIRASALRQKEHVHYAFPSHLGNECAHMLLLCNQNYFAPSMRPFCLNFFEISTKRSYRIETKRCATSTSCHRVAVHSLFVYYLATSTSSSKDDHAVSNNRLIYVILVFFLAFLARCETFSFSSATFSFLVCRFWTQT